MHYINNVHRTIYIRFGVTQFKLNEVQHAMAKYKTKLLCNIDLKARSNTVLPIRFYRSIKLDQLHDIVYDMNYYSFKEFSE